MSDDELTIDALQAELAAERAAHAETRREFQEVLTELNFGDPIYSTKDYATTPIQLAQDRMSERALGWRGSDAGDELRADLRRLLVMPITASDGDLLGQARGERDDLRTRLAAAEAERDALREELAQLALRVADELVPLRECARLLSLKDEWYGSFKATQTQVWHDDADAALSRLAALRAAKPNGEGG